MEKTIKLPLKSVKYWILMNEIRNAKDEGVDFLHIRLSDNEELIMRIDDIQK